jgi:uncharacterized membrane protein YvbJ
VSVVRCPGCGSENASGSAYCRKCARKLDAETKSLIERQRATALATQSTGIRWAAVAASAAAVLILALIVIFLLLFVIH